MVLTGEMLIGARVVRGTHGELRAVDPSTGAEVEPAFGGGTQADVDLACLLAAQAFDTYRSTSLEARAGFLEAIARGILEAGDLLIERVILETGLPRTRVEGERARTVGQLRLFAEGVREGRWIGAILDSALPERALPRPDLRVRKIPLGPVAVFGASNFPLAFSVAGGDTASALAVGCPVIVKAHPSHPGTSEIVGRVIQQAARQCALPEGVFSLLMGVGNAVAEALVLHPAIQAVGFTGSRHAGNALTELAASRPKPIPVFTEMSSTNAVFLLPEAMQQRAPAIARGLIDSVMLGSGQFCTKPGLVFAIEGPAFAKFADEAATYVATKTATLTLNMGIQRAYEAGVSERAGVEGVEFIAQGAPTARLGTSVQAQLFKTDAANFLSTSELGEEIFGPACLVVACKDLAEMLTVAEQLEGQLTATLHLDQADEAFARLLVPILERKAGRILVNGYPTGVEVCHAMVHGGPSPSTSDSRFTSVGTLAAERFLRPVCYQNFPASLLPDSVQDANPLSLWRMRDGKLRQA